MPRSIRRSLAGSSTRTHGVRLFVGLMLAVTAAAGLVTVQTPTAAAIASRTVTVTPSTGLNPAGDSVTISGTGFDSSRGIYVMFCKQPAAAPGTAAGRPTGDSCASARFWITNSMPADPASGLLNWTGSGTFTATLPVSAAFKSIDCKAPGTTCGVVTRNDHAEMSPPAYDQDTFTPVTFADGTVTPPVDPGPIEDTVSIALSKSTGLAAGEVITVTGSGFVPGQGVYVQLCAKPTGVLGTPEGRAARCYPGQDGTHIVWVSPVAADGTFSTPLTVEATFTASDSSTVDCRIADACGVFVRRDHNGSGDYSQDAFAPILVGDAVAAPPAPATLTGNPTTGLNPNGDTVQVSGTGFQPGSAVYVALCDPTVANFGACDLDNAVEATPDASGSFSLPLAVRGSFGTTNCMPGGAACAIRTWAVSVSSAAAESSLPVSFASPAVLPLTGSSTLKATSIALVLVALGALAMVATRRRETA